MKKYLITLVLISVLTLSACGENKDTSKKDNQEDHKTAKEDKETQHQDDHQKFGFKEDGDSDQSTSNTQANESQSEGSGQQSSAIDDKDDDFEMEPGDPSYEDYKAAQESQYALDHPTPEQKASGAGGGGAAWNYADQDESYEDYVERVREQKAAADEN